MYVLRLRNKAVETPGDRGESIPIEEARVCSVCWTVHRADECPECQARQWRGLLALLQTLGVDPWAGIDIRVTSRGVETRMAS